MTRTCPPATDSAEVSAGVVVTSLHRLEEIEQAAALFGRVWRTGAAPPPVTTVVMRAVAHVGGYVAGAWEGGTLVGASMGFLGLEPVAPGRPPQEALVLHSHIAGVERPGRGIGLALKQHQRAWALDRGIGAVTWTFDPLVRRNAWFNLAKLGAVGVEHLPDHYGEMADGVNRGVGSDRLLARWDLRSVPAPHDGTGAVVVLAQRDGRPVPQEVRPEGPWLLALPPDVELLRRTDPALAGQWRAAVRQVLDAAFAAGLQARGTTRDGHLVLAR